MLTIVVLLVLVIIVAVIDYLLFSRLNDGVGSWARER